MVGLPYSLTEGARRVLAIAETAARDFGGFNIGIEHLLLALTFEPEGIAAAALKDTVRLPELQSRITYRLEYGRERSAEAMLRPKPAVKEVYFLEEGL